MAVSKVQHALEQIAKIEDLRKEAINEILEQRKELDAQLKSLGHEVGGTPRRSQRRTLDPNKECPICAFVTTPPHDARNHRGQGKKKKAFTAEELKEFGMVKAPKTAAA